MGDAEEAGKGAHRVSEILRNIKEQRALDERFYQRWGQNAWEVLNQPNALFRHLKTAGASAIDVTPLGSGWDDAMREAAERG